jgi:ankyrin repeat protein
MAEFWAAVAAGDVMEVERLVEQDPGLLEARDDSLGGTPLMLASMERHLGVVRVLVDKGASINERGPKGWTALWLACTDGHAPVVRLLLEKGADPTIAAEGGATPLMVASDKGHPEIVRMLLDHPSGDAILNLRDARGGTALWVACFYGRAGVARTQLERGADTTIPGFGSTTLAAIIKQVPRPDEVTAEARRECVVALEVRLCLPLPLPQHLVS